jgi:hypothetical protein
MPGAVVTNLHHASRAEVLADYVFSLWGTVTPTRRQDDHGIDLYCTLTEAIGRLSQVLDYYSVQVKSNADPWEFKTEDEVRWLFDYPTPLFLACVDQGGLTLSIYQTMPRFLAGMWPPGKRIELIPSNADVGNCAQWKDGERFGLSAPILRITLEDLIRGDKFDLYRNVLRFWIAADRDACALRRMGVLRLRMPHEYRVNEVPGVSNSGQGMTQPSEEHRAAAVRTAVEVLDYIGGQLLRSGERQGAVYAALLLRRLVDLNAALFANILHVGPDQRSPFERDLGYAVNDVLLPGGRSKWLFEGFELLSKELLGCQSFADVIRGVLDAAPDKSDELAPAT